MTVRILGPSQKAESLLEKARSGLQQPSDAAMTAAPESVTVFVSPRSRPAECLRLGATRKPAQVTLRRGDDAVSARLSVLLGEGGAHEGATNIKYDTVRGFLDGRPFRVIVSFSVGDPDVIEFSEVQAAAIR